MSTPGAPDAPDGGQQRGIDPRGPGATAEENFEEIQVGQVEQDFQGVQLGIGQFGQRAVHKGDQKPLDLEHAPLADGQAESFEAEAPVHDDPGDQYRRAARAFFNPATACVGLRFLGQAMTQLRMVWQRQTPRRSSRICSRSSAPVSRESWMKR